MRSDLVFRDLFAYGDRSIGWVHVFRTKHQAVALVIEPSDNPSTSAVNAAEWLVRDLRRAFVGVGDLRVFVRFPNDPRGAGWTELLVAGDRVEFDRRSVEFVQSLCGASLEAGASQPATCAELAGRRHPLLALIPDPEPERDPLDDLAVVAVADLPWAHNPAACSHVRRFQAVQSLYPASGFEVPAVGAHWFLSLTESDFASCEYHAADWQRVAAVSVEIFRRRRPEDTVDSAVCAVEERLGNSPESAFCASLFLDPIVWSPESGTVINGQHRICALKASGAFLSVVDTAGERMFGEPIVGDSRRRACAEIARFWATGAAQ